MFSEETANPSIWSLGTRRKGTSAQPLPDHEDNHDEDDDDDNHEDNHDDEKFAIPPPPRVTRKIGSSSPHVVHCHVVHCTVQMGASSSGGGLHLVLIMIS